MPQVGIEWSCGPADHTGFAIPAFPQDRILHITIIVVMLFPIRDSIPSEARPTVTYGIISICTVVFFYELSLAANLPTLFQSAAFIPARLFDSVPPAQMPPADYGVVGNLVTMIVSLFIHGGWMHLIGNMWFLVIFGDSIENALGHFRFFFFYLGGGIAATMVHAVSAPNSIAPVVGASGAIAAVLGAYFAWYPKARIRTLVFLGLFITVTEIPAFVYLGFWFLLQAFQGTLTLVANMNSASVAWFAHVGGFVFGYLIATWMRLRGQIDLPPPMPER